MNKKKTREILNEFIEYESIESLEKVTKATTNLQIADDHTIVFYHLTSHTSSQKLFRKRLSTIRPGLLILTGRPEQLIDIPYVIVKTEDFLRVQKKIADIIYPNENKLKLIGITGTNGKTTVAHLAMQISNLSGYSAISVGTVGVYDNERVLEKELLATTPSYLEIRRIINKYQEKYQRMFFEVSSHGLKQNRLFNLKLDVCGWTSFSQDHLDYHKTEKNYFESKLLMISGHLKKGADVYVPVREGNLKKRIEAYGITVETTEDIEANVPRAFQVEFNRNNLELAISLNNYLGDINFSKWSALHLPEGRFQILEFNDSFIVIDYAHTPDALEKICSEIKKTFIGYQLHVIFGCGGDRDRSKRSQMGKAVSTTADIITVTTDNPRTEKPLDIISDILTGIFKKYTIIEDREKAISEAIKNNREKEVILIAGKGHENYQDIDGIKEEFCDHKMAIKYIEENK